MSNFTIEEDSDNVATVTVHRPPHNFIDEKVLRELVDILLGLDDRGSIRAVVLASEGKSFCAGVNFGQDTPDPDSFYSEVRRLFTVKVPVVAAIQGAAIGGGLGLALWADFRVACPEARFAGSFARLGVHHGFGLSETLVPLVGQQFAKDVLYTGRRVRGGEAFRAGLCDRLVECDDLLEEARRFAVEIAKSAPLAVASIKSSLTRGLADRVASAIEVEVAEQERLKLTEDHREGVRATAERRLPSFVGR